MDLIAIILLAMLVGAVTAYAFGARGIFALFFIATALPVVAMTGVVFPTAAGITTALSAGGAGIVAGVAAVKAVVGVIGLVS